MRTADYRRRSRAAGDDITIVAVLIATGVVTGTVFNQPFALFGGGITQSCFVLNQGATANLALNSSDTRVLDQVQLRVDQEDATIRSGTRYPIVTSTYSSGSTGTSLSIPAFLEAGLSSALQSIEFNQQRCKAA